MNDVIAVAEYLDLDMAGAFNQLFDEQAAVAERGQRLGARLRHLPLELVHVGDDANAAPAAAGRRLDHHGKAEAGNDVARRCGIVDPPVAARNHRYAGSNGRAPRRDLVAHQADGARRRPNENEASLLDGIGEVGILGEETVARMHRVGAAAGGRGNDRGNVEVRLGRLRRSDIDRLIGKPDGKAILVGGAVGLHRTQTKLLRGPDDPDRDLSSIGDEQGPDLHNVA